MRRWLLWALLGILLAAAGPAGAGEPDLCLACHGRAAGGGQVNLASLAWSGPVEEETLSLCPGVVRAKQELFLTESRLVRLSAALGELEERGVRVGALAAELHRLSDQYRTVLNQPLYSLSGLSARLGRLRAELDAKVQQPLWRLQRARARQGWLGMALVVGLGLVLAALVGWRRRLSPPPESLPLRLAREGRLPEVLRRNEGEDTQ